METMCPLAEAVAETFILEAAQEYVKGNTSAFEYLEIARSFGTTTDQAYALLRKVS